MPWMRAHRAQALGIDLEGISASRAVVDSSVGVAAYGVHG